MVYTTFSQTYQSPSKYYNKMKAVFNMTMFLIHVVSYLVSIGHWFLNRGLRFEDLCIETRISFTVFDIGMDLNIIKKLFTSLKKNRFKRISSGIFFYTHSKMFYLHAHLTFS